MMTFFDQTIFSTEAAGMGAFHVILLLKLLETETILKGHVQDNFKHNDTLCY